MGSRSAFGMDLTMEGSGTMEGGQALRQELVHRTSHFEYGGDTRDSLYLLLSKRAEKVQN